MQLSNETLRVATAIYGALNNGRIPSCEFFTTPATGGADYVKAADAAAAVGANVGAEFLAFIEKHRLTISPQVNGGWVIEGSRDLGDDAEEVEWARSRKSLVEALRLAQSRIAVGANVEAEAPDAPSK